MKCPECGSSRTRVSDSRKYNNAVIRERQCLACGAYFETMETIIDAESGRLMRSRAGQERRRKCFSK